MEVEAYIPKNKIIRKVIDVLNCSLHLTERESEVLALIMDLDLHWSSEKEKNVVDTDSRRYIMQNTYINKNNLSKYIKKYKDKGILVEYKPKKWRTNQNLLPVSLLDGDNVEIIFKLNNLENA